jgi:hypothetical protein
MPTTTAPAPVVEAPKPVTLAPTRVTVVDIDISLGQMIWLAIKAVPALLIAALAISCVVGAATAFISGFMHH